LAQTSLLPFGITIERAEGVFLYGPGGKKYFDMISGIGVSNIGHGNPKVIKAIKDQVDRHLHVMVYGEFNQAPPSALAEKLTSVLPSSLNSCYFVNSGTEANEGALKLAKRYTGRTEIVSCKKSYHGSTHGSLSVSGNEIKKNAFRPLLPSVKFVEFNDPVDLAAITTSTACVIIETVQGDAGVRIPSKDYIQSLRRKCSDTGALLILDEIQCGMGRTGKLFAFEHFGITPDILTIGKAFGGGLPIGAFISSQEIMSTLAVDPPLGHITTFGGNPVCCASALANLEVMLEEQLPTHAEEKGKLLEKLIQHPKVKEVRRLGLMLAIDFDSAERVNRVVEYAKNHGVICYWFLSNPHSLRLAPPLTISESEIRESCAFIAKAIERS
jgi:acetylornithine/succinyldiaminopimelate/putrescine aminotransferase